MPCPTGIEAVMVTSLKYKSLGIFASYEPSLNQIHVLFDLQGYAGGGISKLVFRYRPQSCEFRHSGVALAGHPWILQPSDTSVQVSFQHQRKTLEEAAQGLLSVGEVAMKEVEKENYPICNRYIHVLVVSSHRTWPHLGPTQQVCPVKSVLSIMESQ